MDSQEQALWSDIVYLKNRVNKPLEFMWDSKLYVVPARNSVGKKGLKVPRFLALHGIQKFPVKVEASTGLVEESLLGIDEEDSPYPVTPLEQWDEKTWKESDKAQMPKKTFVDGKVAERGVVELAAHRESFAGNNAD